MQSGNRPQDDDKRIETGLFEIMMGMTPEEWDAPLLSEDEEKDD